ncbi:MAG: RidA family protein [Alphaproteobacteria bacterium]|nr:RidA family protein [Alphaproteobacteria bacterium]
MTITRRHLGPRMAQSVVHGDTIYLAGQVATDTAGGVAGQTESILGRIDQLLAECGSDKSKLLSATIYLTDIATFGEMNGVWEKWVDGKNVPARTTVEAKLAAPQYLVEITVIAAR